MTAERAFQNVVSKMEKAASEKADAEKAAAEMAAAERVADGARRRIEVEKKVTRRVRDLAVGQLL